MQAFITITPDSQFIIELEPRGNDDENILRELLDRGICQRRFGRMGAFDGVEIKLHPGPSVREIKMGTKELKCTCPSNTEEGPPSKRGRTDSH